MESKKQAENERQHMKKASTFADQSYYIKRIQSIGVKNSLNLSNMKGEKMLTGKAAKATISQASIFLHVLQFLHVQTQLQRTTEHSMQFWDYAFYTILMTGNVTVITRTKPLLSHLVCSLITGILQCKVHHGVLEGTAHVELKGDVVHTLQ